MEILGTSLLHRKNTPAQKRGSILKIEEEIGKMPNAMYGDCFPLEHKFLDGCYVRKIKIP